MAYIGRFPTHTHKTAQSLDICEEHFHNHMLYALNWICSALTQSSSLCCNSSSCILSDQHSCCLFQATAPTHLLLHFVILAPLHSNGCSWTNCMGTTFRAAHCCWQICFNAVSEFSPFVQIFFLVPSREEKRTVLRLEKIWLQVPDSWARAGQEGWAGMAGLTWMDAGAWPGRGGGWGLACSYVKTCIGIG